MAPSCSKRDLGVADEGEPHGSHMGDAGRLLRYGHSGLCPALHQAGAVVCDPEAAMTGLAPGDYPRRGFASPCADCEAAGAWADTCLSAAYEIERGAGYVHEVALALAMVVVESSALRRMRGTLDDFTTRALVALVAPRRRR